MSSFGNVLSEHERVCKTVKVRTLSMSHNRTMGIICVMGVMLT